MTFLGAPFPSSDAIIQNRDRVCVIASLLAFRFLLFVPLLSSVYATVTITSQNMHRFIYFSIVTILPPGAVRRLPTVVRSQPKPSETVWRPPGTMTPRMAQSLRRCLAGSGRPGHPELPVPDDAWKPPGARPPCGVSTQSAAPLRVWHKDVRFRYKVFLRIYVVFTYFKIYHVHSPGSPPREFPIISLTCVSDVTRKISSET